MSGRRTRERSWLKRKGQVIAGPSQPANGPALPHPGRSRQGALASPRGFEPLLPP